MEKLIRTNFRYPFSIHLVWICKAVSLRWMQKNTLLHLRIPSTSLPLINQRIYERIRILWRVKYKKHLYRQSKIDYIIVLVCS